MNEQKSSQICWNDINLSKKEEIEDILNQKAMFGALSILILISICVFLYFLFIFFNFLAIFGKVSFYFGKTSNHNNSNDNQSDELNKV